MASLSNSRWQNRKNVQNYLQTIFFLAIPTLKKNSINFYCLDYHMLLNMAEIAKRPVSDDASL